MMAAKRPRRPARLAACDRLPIHVRLCNKNSSAGVVGHICPNFLAPFGLTGYIVPVKAADLIRSIERYAARCGLGYRVEQGKGSHRKIWLGARRSMVPLHGGDLPLGTYRAILRQLGITERDLEG